MPLNSYVIFSELAKKLEERSKRKEQQKKKRTESANKAWNNEKELDYFNNPTFYQVKNLVAKTDELTGNEDAKAEDTVSSKPWSQNEELALIRLTNKYPGGFPNRWTKIAQTLGRSVADVTSKASEIANDLSSRILINRRFCHLCFVASPHSMRLRMHIH